MAHPTYAELGDHTETVQIDFDPRRLSFEALLATFWESHQPEHQGWSRQYLNAVFYHDERQREAALASKAEVERRLGRAVGTEVLPLRTFTPAEDYHQKYILKRHSELAHEMSLIYPRHADFVRSTTVTRLNGYAGGYGSQAQLARDIDQLGLSPQGRRILQGRMRMAS
jgi:peptide-methionine (S)-S-oxide reductase